MSEPPIVEIIQRTEARIAQCRAEIATIEAELREAQKYLKGKHRKSWTRRLKKSVTHEL